VADEKEKTRMSREYIENPDPLDDEDPEYKEEIFETYKYMGWTPE
jgi:hypothetical protein